MNDPTAKQSPALISPAKLNSLALFVFAAITLSWGKGFLAPAGGLDPSWKEALVQATDQGLRFGKDLIFTFGPYHQLYTNTISENLAPLIIGRLIYGLAWGATATALADLSTPGLGWLLAIFMALSGSISNDAPFYALELGILLISIRVTRLRQLVWIALVYSGITTISFCKLSFAVSAGPIIICTLIILLNRRLISLRLLPLVCLVLAALPVAIWVASGQTLSDLLVYLTGPNLSIVMGYSSAMSIDDGSASWQILAYWIGASLVGLGIFKTSVSFLANKKLAYLSTVASLFLFWTAFKAGMVRHDGHGSIAGQALACFAILTIIYAFKEKNYRPIVISSLSALILGLSITSQYFSPIRSRLGVWLSSLAQNTYLFSKLIPSSNAREKLQLLRQDGFSRLLATSERFDLIPINSRTDAMPWDISDLLASGLHYTPRPVIQSYSAYKPNLQMLNKLHFESPKAPSYIVLKSVGIDRRISPDYDYPSIESIASHYQIIGAGSQGSLVLKKSPNISNSHRYKWQATRLPLDKRSAFGGVTNKESWQKLPGKLRPGSRFSIEIKQSFWRRVHSLAFKPNPLFIKIKFDNGQTMTYRILESTTTKVPLYPFIFNNQALSAYIRSIQGQVEPASIMGPMPVAIRLKGSLRADGLEAANLVVEQPISR